MAAMVLDGSVALAWSLRDEATQATDACLDRVTADGAIVPGIWHLEMANVLLLAERKGRITAADRIAAISAMSDLPIRTDPQTSEQAWRGTMDLAQRHRLTSYDAAYLELSLRMRLPLATKDRDLARAARACGAVVLVG